MKLQVIALDYDGTIAQHGELDPEVRSAIAEARASGLVVVLVTGRRIPDLRSKLGDLQLFDAVVAENGALAAFPLAGRSARFSSHCSRTLVGALRERGVEALAGDCVVELDADAAHAVLEVIRRQELPLTLHFNRSRLMVLPQAVSKATGLRETLRILRLSLHNTVGVGDAENDHELLAACELGAAVAWGSPALRAAADLVIEGDGPRAVAGYVRALVAGPRILTPTAPRHRILLGRDLDGTPVSIGTRGRNILIAGDPRSGKSWVSGLLAEQLLLQGYCVCLIDPEGDYEALETLPGVMLLGGNEPPPSMQELVRTLRHADVSVILDLVRLKKPERRSYVRRALQTLRELRRETGLPHRIIVDEAHYFLHDSKEVSLLDNELGGYTLITYRASGLHPDVLAATECALVTLITDEAEARTLHETWGGTDGLEPWLDTLQALELDEAVLLPMGEESRGSLLRFRLAPRLTHHVRHRHKYMDVPVGSDLSFHFTLDDGRSGPTVCSLQELIDALIQVPADEILEHVRRHDLSRWVADVFRDALLAERIREFEERLELGDLPDFCGAVIHAVQERYEIAGPLV